MSPASGPLGGGTDLAITGTNFTDVTDVTIGGSELGGRMVVSPTQITGHTLAANTPGAKDVVVTSGSHGSGTCRGCFSYNPAVTVTAVSPAGGPIDGGTRVTITGTNFTNVTSVTIGLSELGSRTVVSANQITGTTPAAISPGARPVTVFTNASGSGTCDNCFTYDPIVVVAQPFAAGDGHTCGLTSAGAAFCWGYNYWGQLGTGSTTSSSTPVAVSGGLSFSALAAGVYHTCGLTMVGAAYCWGTNFFGAVGNGQYGYTFLSPVAVSGDLSFSALATGAWHTCGLSSAGTAYCWGSNSFGQIGNGTNQSHLTTPTAVSGGLHFSALAAGYRFNCGVTGAGAAYCWGENSTGQLGNGSATESRVPVAVSGNLSFSAVAAGATYACGLTSAGAAYCWGSNVVGQLGTSSTTSSSTPVPVSGGLTFTALAAGYGHACGLTSAWATYCWGDNSSGQLSNGSTTSYSTTPVAVLGGLSFSAIAAGGGHTCGRTSTGELYCWGNNWYGQLGDGTAWTAPAPVAGASSFSALGAGDVHTCGLVSAGAFCWGDNSFGQLGTGSTTSSFTPVPVAGASSFGALATGAAHTCGLTSGGAAWCWGANDYGQLGVGSSTYSAIPVPVSGGLSFTALAAGYGHTCGLNSSGAAYCWGANVFGSSVSYGASPVAVSGGPPFTALVASYGHTCGLTSAGAAYCWGYNFIAQYDDGSASYRYDSIPVAVPGGVTFVALAAGSSHACGLTSAGTAYCWGHNFLGELGDGSTTGSTSPVPVTGGLSFSALAANYYHTCGLTSAGVAYCWGDYSSIPVAVSGGVTFSALTTGYGHTCGLSSAGAAYCWGDNTLGQLGRGTGPVAVLPFTVSALTSAVLTPADALRKPAPRDRDRCGPSTPRRPPRAVAGERDRWCGRRP